MNLNKLLLCYIMLITMILSMEQPNDMYEDDDGIAMRKPGIEMYNEDPETFKFMMKQDAIWTIKQKHVTDNTEPNTGADVIYSINHNDQKYDFKIQTDGVTINSKLYMSNDEFSKTPVFTLKVFNNNDELDTKLHCTKYEDEESISVKEDKNDKNKIEEYFIYPMDIFPKLRIKWEADQLIDFIRRLSAGDRTNINDDKNVDSTINESIIEQEDILIEENMEDEMILSMESPKNEIKYNDQKYKENKMQEMYMENLEKYPNREDREKAVKSSYLEDFLRPFKTITSDNVYMVGDVFQTSYWFHVDKDSKKVDVAFEDCQRGRFTHEDLHKDLDLHTFLKFPVYTWKVFIDEEQQKWSKLEYTKYDKEFRIVEEIEVNKVDEYHFTVEELFPELKKQYEHVQTKTKTTSCAGSCYIS